MKQVKRLFAIILTGIVFLAALPFMASAASASASLSGPANARAGDTITVTLNIGGSGILGVNGQVKYDASKLTLTSATAAIGGSWVVNITKSTGTVGFVAYDGQQTSPINSTKQLIKMTFTMNASVSANDSIVISSQGLQASSGEEAISIGNRSHTISVLAPLSTENHLASLVVSNATLSPAFSENVTSYSVGTVPFSISRLAVTATAKDSKAKVSVSGDTLSVGSNTVRITVTAESGATKTYTISVTREQDPNYVKESNTAVASITINDFFISPPFDKNTTSYVVWLPYETTSITIDAHSESDKARVVIEGGSDLKEGRNEIKITCTAEDGTIQVYLVVAIRASKDASTIAPYPPPTDPDLPIEDSAGIELKDLMLYALMPVLLVGGFGSGYAVKGARKKKIHAKRRDDDTEKPEEPVDSAPSEEKTKPAKRASRKSAAAKAAEFAMFDFGRPKPDAPPQFSFTEPMDIKADEPEAAPAVLNHGDADLPATQEPFDFDRTSEIEAGKKYSYDAFSPAHTQTNAETSSEEMVNLLAEIFDAAGGAANHPVVADSSANLPAQNNAGEEFSELPEESVEPEQSSIDEPSPPEADITEPDFALEKVNAEREETAENYSYDAFG